MRTNHKLSTYDHISQFNRPLIRWVGGKRLIVPKLLDLLPKTFGTYFEPMIGSGALFFSLRPKRAVLGDINPELINFYKVIKDNHDGFYRAVQKLRASKRNYYTMRVSKPVSPLGKAVRFFYLIRLSWNGLYRVNRDGEFNVPFGGRCPEDLIAIQVILNAADALRKARLVGGDFEKTTAIARAGDLVYLDPPYPKGAVADNGFDRYHKTKFTLDEHKRLFAHARRLANRGVYVLLTEAPTERIIGLYDGEFNIQLVKSQSLIAADCEFRGSVNEAVITSYKVIESIQE
ncbi:MAG: Dam family site-specific DNA-(adenine-N6)-methyltransferase [Verrucomicrobia bacterium]|nr:Dam family site-specific DNA-(adenine-N6)-methyltransferase [Verrucomicrobiota bacterium]